MKLSLTLGAVLLGTSILGVPAYAAPTAAAAAQRTSADARLKALYDGFADWQAKEFGYFDNERGETEQGAHLAHVDAQSQLRRAAHERDLLAQLNAIPADRLSPDERVNAAVFRTVLENDVSDAQFRQWEMPFNSDSSFWTYLNERNSLE
ncbi:MAG TPA: DUF885 domain-containing protein, partial [Sphingomicrobium sp.]|nr:DUF885 domain-containing protein [Sphingomicrobium sp.]